MPSAAIVSDAPSWTVIEFQTFVKSAATIAFTPAPETMTSRPAAGSPFCQPAGSFKSVTDVELKM